MNARRNGGETVFTVCEELYLGSLCQWGMCMHTLKQVNYPAQGHMMHDTVAQGHMIDDIVAQGHINDDIMAHRRF